MEGGGQVRGHDNRVNSKVRMYREESAKENTKLISFPSIIRTKLIAAFCGNLIVTFQQIQTNMGMKNDDPRKGVGGGSQGGSQPNSRPPSTHGGNGFNK